MAEIGLTASVIQIASTGLKLSTTLYSFAETVSTADKSITHIAKDVSLTSAVLSELGSNLERDKWSGIASENAIATAEEIVLECSKVFREIEVALGKSIGNVAAKKPSTGKYGISKHVLERLRWPFLQPKMELLRSNLERLKGTLMLMLQVLSHATKAQWKPNDTFERNFDRQQIHSLIQANQKAITNFESLNRTIKNSDGQSSIEKDRAVTFPLERDLLKDVNTPEPPLKSKLNPTASPFISLAMMPEKFETIFDLHLPDTDVQVMSSMDPVMIAAYLEKLGVLVSRVEQARSVLTARKFEATSIDHPFNKIQASPRRDKGSARSQSSSESQSHLAPSEQSIDHDQFLEPEDQGPHLESELPKSVDRPAERNFLPQSSSQYSERPECTGPRVQPSCSNFGPKPLPRYGIAPVLPHQHQLGSVFRCYIPKNDTQDIQALNIVQDESTPGSSQSYMPPPLTAPSDASKVSSQTPNPSNSIQRRVKNCDAYCGYGGGYNANLNHKPSSPTNAVENFALEPFDGGFNSAEFNLTTSTPTFRAYDQANSADEGPQSDTLARSTRRGYRSRKHLRSNGWKGEFETLLATWTTLDEEAIGKL